MKTTTMTVKLQKKILGDNTDRKSSATILRYILVLSSYLFPLFSVVLNRLETALNIIIK